MYFDLTHEGYDSGQFTTCGARHGALSEEPHPSTKIDENVHCGSSGCGWRKGLPGVECSCDYVADSLKGLGGVHAATSSSPHKQNLSVNVT